MSGASADPLLRLTLLFLSGDRGVSIAALSAVIAELGVISAFDHVILRMIRQKPSPLCQLCHVEYAVPGTIDGDHGQSVVKGFRQIRGQQNDPVNCEPCSAA